MAQLDLRARVGRALRRPDPGGGGAVKVVLFCGGQGLRMREASEVAPKPMIPIGNRPVLWHVMKYYAHFGFTDFVLCLGYRAEAIKQYFLTYNEAMANDFVLSDGGAKVHLLKTDIHDWNITFVDTGLQPRSASGCAPCATSSRDDEMFLANYGDTLTDADLPAMIDAREGGRRDGELPRRAPELQLPRRLDAATTGACASMQRRDAVGHLDQRRLLRPAPGDLRPAAPRRGAGRGAVARLLAAGPGARAAPRGLLGADGHAQGQAVAREPARERAAPRGRSGTPTASADRDLAHAASG